MDLEIWCDVEVVEMFVYCVYDVVDVVFQIFKWCVELEVVYDMFEVGVQVIVCVGVIGVVCWFGG